MKVQDMNSTAENFDSWCVGWGVVRPPFECLSQLAIGPAGPQHNCGPVEVWPFYEVECDRFPLTFSVIDQIAGQRQQLFRGQHYRW